MQFFKINLTEIIKNYKTFYKFLDILKQIFKQIVKKLIYFAKITDIRIINEILLKIIENYRNT